MFYWSIVSVQTERGWNKTASIMLKNLIMCELVCTSTGTGPKVHVCQYFHLFHSFMLKEGLCTCAPAASNHSAIQFGLGSVHSSALNVRSTRETVTKLKHCRPNAAEACCSRMCVCVCADKNQITSRLSCVMSDRDGANGCTGRYGERQSVSGWVQPDGVCTIK